MRHFIPCTHYSCVSDSLFWIILEFFSPVIELVIDRITKTYLYHFDPIKPHFYKVKLGFTRVFFLFLLKNIDCGYSLDPPHRNEKNNVYPCKPQFYYIKVGFQGSKLYRRVFVMMYSRTSIARTPMARLLWLIQTRF